MKALTICQPYARLIALPDDAPRAKRVENRTWATEYRGPLLIHAGKSREFLELSADGRSEERYGLELGDLVFGAFVAVADLAVCFRLGVGSLTVGQITINRGGERVSSRGFSRELKVVPANLRDRFPWLASSEHTEGPFCWVLENVRPLKAPIPWQGKQGLWEAPITLKQLGVPR